MVVVNLAMLDRKLPDSQGLALSHKPTSEDKNGQDPKNLRSFQLKKNHTQHLKDRASLLQAHLKTSGISLPRAEALNVMAKVDGYRSFTAAHHGKQHAPGVFADARKAMTGRKSFPTMFVLVANAAQHAAATASRKKVSPMRMQNIGKS
jgi:hypothetical protein